MPLGVPADRSAAAMFIMLRGRGSAVLQNRYICLCVLKRVNISMVVICYACDVIEYGRKTPEIHNAPLHMKQDTTSIGKYPP